MQLRMWMTAAAVGLLMLVQPLQAMQTKNDDSVPCNPKARTANLNFTLKDLAGKDVKLSAYKGKVLLIDFWATWCGPCKQEIPGFIDFYNRYRSQGFEIVGLLALDKFSNAKPFAQAMKMNYPVLNAEDRTDVEEAFGGIFGLPTSFLIGRDGRICKTHEGFAPKEQFEKEIKALLRR